MRRWLFALLPGLLLLVSCTQTWDKFSNHIIEYDPITLSIDNSFFESKGCFQSITCLPDSLLALDPPIMSISKVGTWFGGLSPAIPIAIAYTNSAFQLDESTFLFARHCLESHYVRYLIYMDDEFRIITSREELGALYAPIESPEEAFSLAIAATGYVPLNDLEKNSKSKLEQKQIEETFVQQVDSGYLVHLFDTFMCGCGPHPVQSVDVTVHTDGTLEISAPVPAYRDPELDKICFD